MDLPTSSPHLSLPCSAPCPGTSSHPAEKACNTGDWYICSSPSYVAASSWCGAGSGLQPAERPSQEALPAARKAAFT